jgi:uncharacterized tellurite resistance protein B-like protein
MLSAIKTFLASKASSEGVSQPTALTLQMAAAGLFLEVSRADFKIGEDELKIVAEALKSHFAFSDKDAQELLELALARDEEAVSMHPFLRLINEHFTPDQKRHIIEDMWRVAFADRRLDKYEEAQIRKIADLLYVPHKDFIRTKLRVQQAMDKTLKDRQRTQ